MALTRADEVLSTRNVTPTPEFAQPASTSAWPLVGSASTAAGLPPDESTSSMAAHPAVPLMPPPAEAPPDDPLDHELPTANGANEPDGNGGAGIGPELTALLLSPLAPPVTLSTSIAA